MAQNQGTSMGTQAGGSTAGGMGTGGQGNTGVEDTTYNVISVVYHALQGAETIQKYLRDARGSDHKVEQFLRESQEQLKRMAQRGQECLAAILPQGGAGGQQMQSGAAGGQMGSRGSQGQQAQSGSASGQWGGGSASSGQQSQGGSGSSQMGGSRGSRGSSQS